jgi:hypothetical protein
MDRISFETLVARSSNALPVPSEQSTMFFDIVVSSRAGPFARSNALDGVRI